MHYIQSLRTLIGHRKFIHPAARIIIENASGEYLFITRTDNGNPGLPAGGLEENETIEACIIREVREETGLQIQSLEVIGISTAPARETVHYPNGDVVQYFTIEFYSNQWTGELAVHDTAEVQSARFMPPEMAEHLPENERHAFESLGYWREVGGVLVG